MFITRTFPMQFPVQAIPMQPFSMPPVNPVTGSKIAQLVSAALMAGIGIVSYAITRFTKVNDQPAPCQCVPVCGANVPPLVQQSPYSQPVPCNQYYCQQRPIIDTSSRRYDVSMPPYEMYGSPYSNYGYGVANNNQPYNYYCQNYSDIRNNPYQNNLFNAVMDPLLNTLYNNINNRNNPNYAHYRPDPWSYYTTNATYGDPSTIGVPYGNGTPDSWATNPMTENINIYTDFGSPQQNQPSNYGNQFNQGFTGTDPFARSNEPAGSNIFGPNAINPCDNINSTLNIFTEFNNEFNKNPFMNASLRNAQSPSTFSNLTKFGDIVESRRDMGNSSPYTAPVDPTQQQVAVDGYVSINQEEQQKQQQPTGFTGLGTLEEYQRLHPGLEPGLSYNGQYIL